MENNPGISSALQCTLYKPAVFVYAISSSFFVEFVLFCVNKAIKKGISIWAFTLEKNRGLHEAKKNSLTSVETGLFYLETCRGVEKERYDCAKRFFLAWPAWII